MMTRAEIESAIERHGEKAEIISLAREVLALFTERDDAQARVRELEATTTAATIRAVHKALGATVGQSVVTRAEEVMEELRAIREDDAARRVAASSRETPARRFGELRDIEIQAWGAEDHALCTLSGCVRLDRDDNLWTAIPKVSARVEELVHEVKRLQFAAESEPPQVFRPSIVVIVNHTPKRSYAEVVVGEVTDPTFLTLPYGTRLGLVVLRG